jgi:hypothetical protein
MTCGGHTAVAQLLSSSSPIVIRFSEIDRYGVSVMPEKRALDGARLGLPYHSMKPAAVDALVRDGTFLDRPVWIMDGARVIAQCRLLGMYIWQSEFKLDEYGLCLRFDSVEEAQKVGAIVKVEPSIEDLLRQRKSKASDPRFWIF